MSVRVPTYARSKLLQRALKTLLAQTWPRWKATIFDDSPGREALEVVEMLGDKRLRYVANPERLGASRNLDQCFSDFEVDSTDYAFVLEDDNGIHATFIAENIQQLSRSSCRILLRNQAIFDQTRAAWADSGKTVFGDLYVRDRVLEPQQIHFLLFMGAGISNGGIFWKPKEVQNDLVVGPSVKDAGIQELCRTAQISEAILYRNEPLGIWTRLPEDQVIRTRTSDRQFALASQYLRADLCDKGGQGFVRQLRQFAKQLKAEEAVELSLASVADLRFRPVPLFEKQALAQFAKGVLRRTFLPNPVKGYFSENRKAVDPC